MEDYQIINALLHHIETAKEGDDTLSLTDIILDFVDTNDIEFQRVIEAVQEDVYFKKILMNDCISRSIIKTEGEALKNW